MGTGWMFQSEVRLFPSVIAPSQGCLHRPFPKVQDRKVGNRIHTINTPWLICVLQFRGRSVTALGVLYNFTGNDVNTTVQPVADMVKEAWVWHPLVLNSTLNLTRSNHTVRRRYQWGTRFLLAGRTYACVRRQLSVHIYFFCCWC